MHNNPDLFPNPRTFSPERWLQPNAAELRKYIVSFGSCRLVKGRGRVWG